MLWPGRNDKNRRSAFECIKNHPELSESIIKMASAMRFFLAPLPCTDRLRKRVEAAIALPLYDVPGMIGNFQEEFQRKTYNKDKRTINEKPIACVVDSPVPLLGLREHLVM